MRRRMENPYLFAVPGSTEQAGLNCVLLFAACCTVHTLRHVTGLGCHISWCFETTYQISNQDSDRKKCTKMFKTRKFYFVDTAQSSVTHIYWLFVYWLIEGLALNHLTKCFIYKGWVIHCFNPLASNDLYRGRTAPLTSRRCILYTYSTNIGTEYFKHGIYSPFFLFKMQFVS